MLSEPFATFTETGQFAESVRVPDDVASREAEVLDRLVQDAFSFISKGSVLGFAAGVSRVSVLCHPPHDVGEVAGGVGDSLGDFRECSRPFEDHDFGSAVDLPRQGDEAAYLLVDVGQVGVVGTQRGEDGVHGNVAVVERAEVAGVCVAAVLAAPLIMLRACLCPAAHDRGTKSGDRADSGAEQCGKSCVHGLSLPSLSFIQCAGLVPRCQVRARRLETTDRPVGRCGSRLGVRLGERDRRRPGY